MPRRFQPGDTLPVMRLETAEQEPVTVPDPAGRLVHVQFRRFAGCPICDLHLRTFTMRISEIETAGVREVVFFHSDASELREYTSELPFAVIPDPAKRWYARLGVESGARALLDPRVWSPTLRAVLRSTAAVLAGRAKAPRIRQPNGRLGLPADLLVDADGRVVAAKYGAHAYDQWSVDEVLALAASRGAWAPRAASTPAGSVDAEWTDRL